MKHAKIICDRVYLFGEGHEREALRGNLREAMLSRMPISEARTPSADVVVSEAAAARHDVLVAVCLSLGLDPEILRCLSPAPIEAAPIEPGEQ